MHQKRKQLHLIKCENKWVSPEAFFFAMIGDITWLISNKTPGQN